MRVLLVEDDAALSEAVCGYLRAKAFVVDAVPSLAAAGGALHGAQYAAVLLDLHLGDGDGLSLLPRAHYAALRARYGAHLVDGVAGESLLLDTDGPWTEADLHAPLWLETAEGELLELVEAAAAPPCVEFSRFCLQLPVGPVGADVRRALDDLDGGSRGFYVSTRGTGRVERGARLLRA